ncbi:uncharacterized protein LOC106434687 [Brassica napus]|uniref:uncharacterized protein LOC106434687 n=1 Tax=Brassica napus TaxID=3708 RepID=UPI002079E08F|nr:uncharacterized protein LOC106434687 [Brassica napus]
MSKISNRDYAALNLSGDNYMQWALDTKISLRSKGLGDTIIKSNNETDKNRYMAIGIIRHHLIEGLKDQYITMENSLELWDALQHRYDHQKTVLLPKARNDWKNLRFLDYKSVDEYNSVLFKTVSMLRLCGEVVTEEDLLEKTYSTFHSSNVILQQQYKMKGFATYTDLISCLLLAEANNKLLMKNSEARPVGTAPLPEANEIEKKEPNECNYVQNNKISHSNGRCGYKGRGSDNYSNSRDNYSTSRKGNHNNRGRGSNYGRGRGSYGRGRGGISKPSYSTKSVCHRCGMGNHWAKNCRTPKHLCELYQESLKNKNLEAHMVHDSGYEADNDSDIAKDDQMDFETSDCLND